MSDEHSSAHAASAVWWRPRVNTSITPASAGAALREYGIVLVFIALFVTLALSSPAFLTSTNLLNILDQWAPAGIVACGATIVILAGGFDLSVGAIFGLAGIVAAQITNSTSPLVGILAGIGFALALGVFNGVLVTMLRINSFIATLATGFMFIGLAQVLTSGNLISITDPGFQVIGTDALLGVKYSTWIFILAVVASAIVLRYTVFGRYVFSVGGNSVAARLSGVNVNLVRLGTFALSGLLAGVAGVIAASRVATGQIDAGAGLELTAIAAVVIGGTSIMGGEGAIWRTVLGLLILALIGNGFNILNVEPFYQSIVQGGVIVIAVAIDAWGRRRD